jgi:sulfatase modifying factor 1
MTVLLLALTLSVTPLAPNAGGVKPVPRGMVRIEAASFRPLYWRPGEELARVRAFAIDTVPVSQASFLAFTRRVPRWAKGQASASVADANYLEGISDDPRRPVTNVSQFAAAAYCSARAARLPTTTEWEYVARASERSRDAGSDPAFRQRTLELALAAEPSQFVIGSGFRNVWGVRDLHGGVNEWTADFQTMVGGKGGAHAAHEKPASTCSAGVSETGDSGDYSAFLRHSFRQTAQPRTGAPNLGFRCASSL